MCAARKGEGRPSAWAALAGRFVFIAVNQWKIIPWVLGLLRLGSAASVSYVP